MQLTAFKPAPAKSGLENAHVTARETGGREASAGGRKRRLCRGGAHEVVPGNRATLLGNAKSPNR